MDIFSGLPLNDISMEANWRLFMVIHGTDIKAISKRDSRVSRKKS